MIVSLESEEVRIEGLESDYMLQYVHNPHAEREDSERAKRLSAATMVMKTSVFFVQSVMSLTTKECREWKMTKAFTEPDIYEADTQTVYAST